MSLQDGLPRVYNPVRWPSSMIFNSSLILTPEYKMEKLLPLWSYIFEKLQGYFRDDAGHRVN